MDAITERDALAPALTEPRARIGLIIPSVNRMTEPQFNHYAPEGTRHPRRARPRCRRAVAHRRRTDRRNRPRRRHARRRRSRSHRVSLHPHLDEGRRRRRGAHHQSHSQRTTGIEALSTSSLVNDALHALGLHKLVLLSPYSRTRASSLISPRPAFPWSMTSRSNARPPPSSKQSRRSAGSNWREENDRPEADGIFLSCTNTTQIEAVAAIEEALGKPVVNSNQAVLWGCLKRLKGKLGDSFLDAQGSRPAHARP